ncbi:LytTR family DNA-binding domain-containing protein [Membranicola marinus]|uniref:LytTR family DNA-binding domain-containing protein n=1 Tax=Membranihabitans marinus TaxID=1227546 RepID=A0A953HV54_9BACT|nr:LytTR family DNA-binding domain-containing protein [Membranihabitans marinus]MBY5958428.1 LytTR family DNA-binding domain-containing protein [Membranihabitans marinus]
MINTIIVDDEPLAQEILETYLESYEDFELIGTCKNAMEANKLLKDNKVDVMFLDIQMPQLNGIDFLKILDNPPLVVFTTAFKEYALEGFELDALDYLLKPISKDRFSKAIDKIRAELGKSSEAFEDSIFVKSDKKLHRLFYDEIFFIEGLKDYVIIKTAQSRIVTLQTMKSLEVKLPHRSFMRIHRSYIINLDKIKSVIGNNVEIEIDGKKSKLPIGKIYRDDLLDIVNSRRL